MAYDNFPLGNKRTGRLNACCNNQALSWWDVIGCDSFASWILMIAQNAQETFILLYFLSHLFYLSWSELVKENKRNGERSVYLFHFTFILFYVRHEDSLTSSINRRVYNFVCWLAVDFIFTARCNASAVLAMALCPSVRQSVCPSVTSRSSTKKAKRRHTIAQGL